MTGHTRALVPSGARRAAMASLSPYKLDASGAFPDLQMSMDDTPFEDLLQSVLRGSLFEEQLPPGPPGGAGGQAAGGAGGEAGLGAARASMRCLDSTHPATCELCLPPPIVGEEGAARSAGARRSASTPRGMENARAAGVGAPARVARPSHTRLTGAPPRSAIRAGR